MNKSTLQLSLLTICFLALSLESASAQVPAVPNTIPNVTQVPGTLIWRSPDIQDRVTNIAYHNGWFYSNTVGSGDRKAWRFTNTTSAGSFIHDTTITGIPSFVEHGNHAHTKVGDWLGGYYGFNIKRQSLGVNSFASSMPEQNFLSGVTEGHVMYWPWRNTFQWVQYAGLNGDYPNVISRPDPNTGPNYTSKAYAAWNSLKEEGVVGNSVLVGNILLVTSDASNLGVLSYDISPIFKTPAQPPLLLDKLVGEFGAYIATPFENYLILTNSETFKVEVIDYSDPTNLRLAASIDVRGDQAKNGPTNVPYTQAQDNFIFTMRHKIDMNSFQKVLQFDEIGNNRPAGSVTGVVDTSQYMKPIGNLLISAGYSFGDPDRVCVWAHQTAPDTKKPYVGYHIPRPGQTNYPLGAPISLLIHEALESYTIINGVTITLREVGTTTPLDAWTSFSSDGMLTLTPKAFLLPDKTYEVIIADGGIKDALNNGIEPYSFTFSTGNSTTGGNASPTITAFTAGPSPVATNGTVTFSAAATDPESDSLQYRVIFGDNSAPSAWGSTTSFTKTYATTGHYEAKLQVRDLKPSGATSSVSKTLTVTVANTIAGALPTNSSTIVLHSATRRIWVVNPDADTVSVLNADTNVKVAEHNLASLIGFPATASVDPRNIALDASGNAWITCHDADRILVLSPSGTLLGQISTGYGSAPYGVVMTPNGSQALVTLTGSGILKRYDTNTRTETSSLLLGPTARALAVTNNGTRILVTRFVSEPDSGSVWDVNNGTSLTLTRTIRLYRDRTADKQGNGRGIPTNLTSIVISPDQEWVWITAAKLNDQHGLLFNGRASTDNGPRAMVARFRLSTNREEQEDNARLDIDNSESPSAVVFSPRNDWAFITLQGNNRVVVYDELFLRAGGSRTATKWRFNTNLAPQGLIIDPSTNKLFVHNFMSRTVTVHDLSTFFSRGERDSAFVTVPTVAQEKLTPTVLLGKQIFYNASLKTALGADAMGADTYVSCATCHVDGSQDGRVWDFTQRGEGLRNTIDLRGRVGMGHGNVHWSANFDEIQDFENDIRDHFGGAGLINSLSVSTPLGTPKTGLNSQLDALSAYVSSLNNETLPKSPNRASNGTMSSAAIAGEAVFASQSCNTCHGGNQLTDSTGGIGVPVTLHDVGTLRTTSGGRLGAALNGIDTPTLAGIHATAPYFHDGSARTLEQVFQVAGGTVYQAELATLSGATELPGFININYFNVPRKGGLVQFNGVGTMTLANINGGPTAGVGAIEFLITSGGNQTVTVRVNSTNYSLPITSSNPGWQFDHYVPVRLENVSLNAGATNTIQVTSSDRDLGIDEITVSTAADLAKAQPHRRVNSLSNTDRTNLIQYLKEIDGSSIAAIVAPSPGGTGVGGIVLFRQNQSLASNGSQDTLVPAGDGVANLLKYAFNMIGTNLGQAASVTVPNSTVLLATGSVGLPLVTVVESGPDIGKLQITYVRRKAASNPGITYKVEFSNTLAAGSWGINTTATELLFDLGGAFERVVVTDSSNSASRRFARVVITAQGDFSIPSVSSLLTSSGSQGGAYSYQITATGLPQSYAAGNLPLGLSVNSSTGLISGVPQTIGVFNVTLTATNTIGISNPAVLVLSISLAQNTTNRATGGSPTSSNTDSPGAEQVAQAFDGAFSTKWLTSSSSPWIRYTFAGTTSWTITRYALVSGNDFPERDPRNWQLQGSTDGTNWTTLDSRTDQTFTSRNQRREFTVTNPSNYRSYRLLISANQSGTITQLAELELY